MKVYYDLHIHSILSACADELQTPNNILNMAMLKELQLISITDHNSLKQYETIDRLKSSFDFEILYGVEITVLEGFHILAYFEKFIEAYAMDDYIDRQLDHQNDSFHHIGEQVVCDEYDLESYAVNYFLNQPLKDDLVTVCKQIRKLNGLIILAHVDRKNSGILSHYDDLSQFDFDGIEISYHADIEHIYKKYPNLKKYKLIINSDAHSLEIINERENYLELEENSFQGFKQWLKTK